MKGNMYEALLFYTENLPLNIRVRQTHHTPFFNNQNLKKHTGLLYVKQPVNYPEVWPKSIPTTL
jgi:hypothetical protein